MPRLRQERHDALTKAISRVLTPVMICMALSVWFVHGLGDPKRCKDIEPRRLSDIPLLQSEESSNNTPSTTTHSSLWAGIFIGVFALLMVIFTFLIVWLYKSGRTRIIQGWILSSVLIIFSYVGGLYIFDFCRSHCINLDWISLCIAVWNFTITGLFAIFGVVPRVINQAYLIVMSALMAYIFRTLPAWSIWTILAVLVVWDLFAVLSKYGPLRKLVEVARDRGDPLPALVYDTNPHDNGRDDRTANGSGASKSGKKRKANRRLATPQWEDVQNSAGRDANERKEVGTKRWWWFRKAKEEKLGEAETGREEDEDSGIGTLGADLKLGLGDFVFYSILVAEASKSSAMTAVTSFVAILAGLCATLFLVTVCRKALPALPISITAGLLFFVLTRYTVQPFVTNLLPELLFH